MSDTYNLISVGFYGYKSDQLRRIHFAEKLIGNYKETLNGDLKSEICCDALCYAIMESGYSAAYLATDPTNEENFARALENRLPSFFEIEPPSDEAIFAEMKDEADMYRSERDYARISHEILIGYFDRGMADLYNTLAKQLMDKFEQAEKSKDDWDNYSL